MNMIVTESVREDEGVNDDFDRYLNHEWEQRCRADNDEQEMIIYWGERCAITQEGCCVCDAWKHFDDTGEVVKC